MTMIVLSILADELLPVTVEDVGRSDALRHSLDQRDVPYFVAGDGRPRSI
jgi:hypothetical protein